MPTTTFSYAAAAPVLFKARRNVAGYEVGARFESNVEIPTLFGQEAPLALRLRKQGMPPIEWRLHDGALWRPLLHMTGRPLLMSAEQVGEGLRARHQKGFEDVFGLNWQDNPIGRSPRDSEVRLAKAAYVGAPLEDMDAARHDLGGIDAVRDHVAGVVGNDLAEIDGVLHRRSVQPAWGYAGPDAYMPYNLGALEMVVLDWGSSAAPCLFDLDQKDEAQEFARVAHERLMQAVGGRGPEGHVQVPLADDDAVDVLCELPAFDPSRRGLEYAAWSVLDCMSDMSVAKDGYDAVRLGVGFVEAARAASRDVRGIDADAFSTLAEEAFDRIGAAGRQPRLQDALSRIAVASDRVRRSLLLEERFDAKDLRV